MMLPSSRDGTALARRPMGWRECTSVVVRPWEWTSVKLYHPPAVVVAPISPIAVMLVVTARVSTLRVAAGCPAEAMPAAGGAWLLLGPAHATRKRKARPSPHALVSQCRRSPIDSSPPPRLYRAARVPPSPGACIEGE